MKSPWIVAFLCLLALPPIDATGVAQAPKNDDAKQLEGKWECTKSEQGGTLHRTPAGQPIVLVVADGKIVFNTNGYAGLPRQQQLLMVSPTGGIPTRLPVPYTIDHMGRVKAADGFEQAPFRALLDVMIRDDKCWVKVCGCERVSSAGPPFVDAVPFARKIVETAPDRVIWGTDWPHPNVKAMPNDGDLVDLIPLFAADEELQHKLLVDNPARLFGF